MANDALYQDLVSQNTEIRRTICAQSVAQQDLDLSLKALKMVSGARVTNSIGIPVDSKLSCVVASSE